MPSSRTSRAGACAAENELHDTWFVWPASSTIHFSVDSINPNHPPHAHHTSFRAAYGERAKTAIAFAMNEEFARVLQRQMDHFNGPQGDNLAAVQQRLDDVRNVMVRVA